MVTPCALFPSYKPFPSPLWVMACAFVSWGTGVAPNTVVGQSLRGGKHSLLMRHSSIVHWAWQEAEEPELEPPRPASGQPRINGF